MLNVNATPASADRRAVSIGGHDFWNGEGDIDFASTIWLENLTR